VSQAADQYMGQMRPGRGDALVAEGGNWRVWMESREVLRGEKGWWCMLV
jgi:hypothetical protein